MSIHTRIEQPISIRKDLLEGAIDGVEILKTIENVKKIHYEKEILRKKLKIVLDKLKILDNRLAKNIPRLPSEKKKVEPEEVMEKPIKEKFRPKKEVKMPHQNRMSSELDILRRKIESL